MAKHKTQAKKKKKEQKQEQEQEKSPVQQFSGAVLALPRFFRIIIIGVFALAAVLAVSPIIDEIYLRFFYTPGTAIAPSLISATVGLAMYLIGWVLIVGTIGEKTPARTIILWYFVVGAIALIVVGLWLLRLVILGSGS